MTATVKPGAVAEVRDVVAWAAGEQKPLEIVGGGSKRDFGQPFQAAYRLDLSGLAGVTLYEPAEMVLTALAGTRLTEIEALLAEHGQELPFEPGDWGPIYGLTRGASTLGGVIACNLSGPRRVKAGAARDHFIGLAGISGRAEVIKSGGRVVKNVTGYDLCKLLAGSHGQLMALTEITLKVGPRAEKARTLLLFGLDEVRGSQALRSAAGSPCEPSGLAHLPAAVAARSRVDLVVEAGTSVTAIRVEGPGPSVDYRLARLKETLAVGVRCEELHSMRSRKLWAEVRDVAPLLPDAGRQLWRLSVPPASAAEVAANLRQDLGEGVELLFDWAGGLIWLALPALADAGQAHVRAALAGGGHATLVRADVETRGRVAVFPPLAPGLAALEHRVRAAFDPLGLFNLGRLGLAA
ncbi:MAG: FAD-binding protein [Alphaproteobacteria bacterium]|nr:FAD-binding protein [Alphaproteobacteria bacterium]